MKIARELERRLESVLDGLAGRIFRGGLHPSEMAARIAREAELAQYETPAGPGTANEFSLSIHPSNLTTGATAELSRRLAETFEELAADRGWRLEGPVRVEVTADPDIASGSVRSRAAIVPGPLPPWAQLGNDRLGHNRTLVGRASDSDLVVQAPEVSRHHAVIFRQDGQAYVVDLGSANGTTVNGAPVNRLPVRIDDGSILSLAGHDYRFTHHAPHTTHHPQNA